MTTTTHYHCKQPGCGFLTHRSDTGRKHILSHLKQSVDETRRLKTCKSKKPNIRKREHSHPRGHAHRSKQQRTQVAGIYDYYLHFHSHIYCFEAEVEAVNELPASEQRVGVAGTTATSIYIYSHYLIIYCFEADAEAANELSASEQRVEVAGTTATIYIYFHYLIIYCFEADVEAENELPVYAYETVGTEEESSLDVELQAASERVATSSVQRFIHFSLYVVTCA